MKTSAILWALLVAWLCFSSSATAAQLTEQEILRHIGVDEKPGIRIPLDLPFTDDRGRAVTLKHYFTGEPVILTLNYYSCPMLCPLTFRNLIATMGEMQGLSLGRDFRIVTVSIDPEETLQRAREKVAETHGMLQGSADPGERWSFLLGKEPEIERLAGTVGYRYLRLGTNNFAHPSVLIVLTPDGRIARYLYGLELKPRDLKLALIEASDGKIGGSTVMNRVLLYCFHYDAAGRKYSLAAINIMKLAGAVLLLLLGVLFLTLWRQEKRRTAAQTKDTP
jgi:protein SCO1/2